MALVDNLRWSTIGVVFRYLLQILSIVILTRWLSPEDFGLLASVLIITSLVTVLAQCGAVQIIGTSNKKNIGDNFITCLIIAIAISLLMTGVLFAFKSEIAEFLNISDIYIYITLITSILFRAISSSLEGVSVYFGHFKSQAKIETISYFWGYFFVSIILVYFGFGVYGIALGTVLQPIIIVFLFQHHLRNEIKEIIKEAKFTPRTVMKRAKYIVISQLSSNFISQVDNLIVNKFFGIKELGFYTRSYQIMIIPCNLFGQVVNKVLLNYFSGYKDGSDKLIIKILALSFLFSILVKAVLFIVGEYLIVLFFGPSWLPINSVILILSTSIFPRLVYKVSEPILISSGEEKNLSKYVLVYAVSLLFFIYIFMSDNVMSIALSVTLSTWLYSALCLRRVVKIKKVNTLKLILIIFLSVLSDLCILVVSY